jgi:hypothetical protein
MRSRFSARLVFPALASAALTLTTAVPAPLLADDVHLQNGNVFEGVIARVEGQQVKIRLPHGELTLPLDRVARIDHEASPLQEYLERRSALLGRETVPAEAWLELAQWAAARQLDQGAKEAALAAAKIDPRRPELQDLLGRFGYVYNGESGQWLSPEEYRRQAGWVFAGGRWISPEEAAEASRIAAEARARVAEQAAQSRQAQLAAIALETAIEARVQAEVARETVRQPYYPYFHTPVVVVSPFIPIAPPHRPPDATPGPGTGQDPPFLPAPRTGSGSFRVEGSLAPGPAPGRLRVTGRSSP